MASGKHRRRGKVSVQRNQRTLDLDAAPALVLPAKLPDGPMHTLFVGISPAPKSAATNHFFAHPSNMFWKMVYHAGIWSELKGAAADDDMVKAGFGFTDLTARAASASRILHPSDFAGAKMKLRSLCAQRKPKTVAFIGKQAASTISGFSTRELMYGAQTFRVAESPAYLLPSTGAQSLLRLEYSEILAHFRDFSRFIQSYWHPPTVASSDRSR